MAAWRRAIELAVEDAVTAKLGVIAQSRTEPAGRVERARILLAYREDPSFFAVGQALGLQHQTVQRCVGRAVAEGAMAALDDRVRPGREPIITVEAKAWLTDLACLWLSARTVDDAAARPARARAWTAGGSCMPCQGSTGYGLQDPQPGRREAAQGALLSGAPRSRVCRQDGRGTVRLSPGENHQKGRSRLEEDAGRAGGDRFLRREAGHPGHCNDRSGPAARAQPACELRPRA